MGKRGHQHWALRAADSDREQVIDQLREHCAAGRLTLDEFEARLEEVWAARTYMDLHAVTRELPRLERRSSWDGLPVGRHVLANALIWVGWLALDPNVSLFVQLPVLTTLASVVALAIQARITRRRLGRRGTWRVVPGDRWQIAARPPRGPNFQAMLGSPQWGNPQWGNPHWRQWQQWQQDQRQQWPPAQPDRRTGT